MSLSKFICCLTLLCASYTRADTLAESLAASAPDADPKAITHALRASACAVLKLGAKAPKRLALIDYSLPSVDRRLWIFDLQTKKLLLSDYVAHGRGSGDNYARSFSNQEGSLQSSLGLFTTAESYVGIHGRSLRLDGLEPGINDQARARAIVVHGAEYVDVQLAVTQGRIGRSFGCPALRPAIVNKVIDALQGGQMLYAYYLDRHKPGIRTMTNHDQSDTSESALLSCRNPN